MYCYELIFCLVTVDHNDQFHFLSFSTPYKQPQVTPLSHVSLNMQVVFVVFFVSDRFVNVWNSLPTTAKHCKFYVIQETFKVSGFVGLDNWKGAESG